MKTTEDYLNDQREFQNTKTSDDRRKELLLELQERAKNYDPSKICMFSEEKEVVFYAEWTEALIPGHIYSREGIKEYGISGTCEYHFDKWADGETEQIDLVRNPDDSL